MSLLELLSSLFVRQKQPQAMCKQVCIAVSQWKKKKQEGDESGPRAMVWGPLALTCPLYILLILNFGRQIGPT